MNAPWFGPPTPPWYPGANAGVSFSLTAPPSPCPGHFWWDGTTLWLWDGVAWNTTPTDLGVALAEPSHPFSGQMWWDGSTARLWSGTQWVAFSAEGPTGPEGPPGLDGATNPATLLQQNPTFLNGGALVRMSASLIGVQTLSCADSSGTVWIRTLPPGPLVKDLTLAWTAGNSGGAMGIGVVLAPSTWYYVFAIINSGNADAYVDSSVVGANAPAGTTARRRIGAILTNSANQIFNFQQNGDMVTWCPLGADVITIINQTLSNGAAQATQIRNTMVPPGVQTVSLLTGNITIITATGTQNFQAVFYPTFMGSFSPASFAGFISLEAVGSGGLAAFDTQVVTDPGQMIGLGWGATATSTQININCRGYIDTRGKL